MQRRNFLKLGALFVPAALSSSRRAYSFLWARPERYVWEPVLRDDQVDALLYAVALGCQLPPYILGWQGTEPPPYPVSRIVIKSTISI